MKKLYAIVSLMKDSMMLPYNFSTSTPSICFVYPTVQILKRFKVLLMHLLIFEFYIYLFLRKQTTVEHVSPKDDGSMFGFYLKTDELYKTKMFILVMLTRSKRLFCLQIQKSLQT